MQALMQDKDALQLLAAQLTREDAGRLLAPLCKAGAAFVRAADAAAVNDAGARAAAVFREGPPMWSLERTYERIGAKYTVDKKVELVLRSLAGEIDLLRQEGICGLEFEFAKAKKKTCLLGCHTLYVLDPVEFLVRLTHRWLLTESHRPYAAGVLIQFRGNSMSDAVINLFRRLGLKRPGRGSRFTNDPYQFKGAGAVSKTEPLWYKKYVA